MKKAYVLHFIVAILSIVLLFIFADYLPFFGNVDNTHRVLISLIYAWSVVPIALFCLIYFFYKKKKSGVYRKDLFFPGVALIVCALVVFSFTFIMPGDFARSRKELDAFVQDIRATQQPGWYELYGFEEARRVGKADIYAVDYREDGSIVITDADRTALWLRHGWINTLNAKEPTMESGTLTPEGDNWYSFTEL